MIDIKEVKAQVTTKEGLEFYGVHFNTKGFAHCPFHQEKTPSFHYNQKKDQFYCFSCGRGGDLVDFVAEYFQFSLPKDLPKVLQKIDQDFGLGLDKRLSPRQQKQLDQQREEEKQIQRAKEQWEASLKDNYNRWGNVFHKVFRMFGECEAKNPEFQELVERFEDAFDDPSGNTFRGWPPQDLSRQQKRWLVTAVRGEGQRKQPEFETFRQNHKQDRMEQTIPPGRSLEVRRK